MGTMLTIAKRSMQSFGADKCAQLSAAIAYYTVFAIFPMALVGVSVLGIFVGGESARQSVVDGIAGTITLGDQGKEALAKTLSGASDSKGIIGLIGLIGALFSASGLFGAIRSALDRVWDVDRPLPLLRAKLRDLQLFIGFGGLLAASSASTGILTAARVKGASWLGPVADMAAPAFVLLIFVVPLLLTFAAFMFLYKTAPHARLSWGDVLPAAVIAAIFFEFGKNLLSYYILNLSKFNALAGSLGAAILMLVFIYYSSQVILLAAEIAKHRMLIKAGAVTAADPKVAKPKVPLMKKMEGMLARLWNVKDVHHDNELPYAPARMDPVTNAPNNTKEFVEVKQQEALERAAEDAAGGGAKGPQNTTATGRPAPAISSSGLISGEAHVHNGVLTVHGHGANKPIKPTKDVVVLRDGQKAKLKDVQAGDRVTVQMNPGGEALHVDARSAAAGEQSVDWVALAGVAASAFTQYRQMQSSREKKKEKQLAKAGGEGRESRRRSLLRR